MRDNLLDAVTAIDWAVAQLPMLNTRVETCRKTSPYARIEKLDVDGPRYCLLIGEREPLDRFIFAEAGAIINSLRSSLDLAAATCARAMGIKPDINTHFPFFQSRAHFLDAEVGLHSPKYKRWLSADDRSVIEAVKPYEGAGGNALLCALHHLDVVRKHERFIKAYPTWRSFGVRGGVARPMEGQSAVMEPLQRPINRNGESIVAYVPEHMAKGQPHVASEVVFNEPEILVRRLVCQALDEIACRCKHVIERFK